MQYDLEERTARFEESVIAPCKKIKRSHITDPLVGQLIRSGTSVGANYMEATGASSKRDFANKIFICKKEVQESKHWLRMLASCGGEEPQAQIRTLWKEAQELTLIFNKIGASSRSQ